MSLSSSFALILALVTALAFGLSLSLPYVLCFIVLLLLISRTLLSASARAAFAQSTSSCRIKVIRIKAAHARRLPHSRTVCTGRSAVGRGLPSATTPAASEVPPRCAAPPQPPPAAPPAPRALARRICSPGYRILAPASLCVLAQQANLRPAAPGSGAKQCHAVRHGTRASHGTSTFCLRALTSARLRPLISPRTARAASRAAAPRPDQRMSHIICALDRLAHISVGTDCGPRPSRARAP